MLMSDALELLLVTGLQVKFLLAGCVLTVLNILTVLTLKIKNV